MQTRPFASIAYGIRNHLPRGATQSYPHPDLVRFFEHKGPAVIEFQDRTSGLVWSGIDERRASRRKLGNIFLIHLERVVRETPNVRVRPRKLLRSWYASKISSRRAWE